MRIPVLLIIIQILSLNAWSNEYSSCQMLSPESLLFNDKEETIKKDSDFTYVEANLVNAVKDKISRLINENYDEFHPFKKKISKFGGLNELSLLKILSTFPKYLKNKNEITEILEQKLWDIADNFALYKDFELENIVDFCLSGTPSSVFKKEELFLELKNIRDRFQRYLSENNNAIQSFVEKISKENKFSRAQVLYETFKRRFPKNYKMMVAFFGENTLKNEGIENFFNKILNLQKGPVSIEQAVYISSLIRIDEGFFGEGFKLSYNEKNEKGEVLSKSIYYNNLEDEFLLWAINKNIRLVDFSIAYELFLKHKKQLRIKHGKETNIKIQARKQSGEALYRDFRLVRPMSEKQQKIKFDPHEYEKINKFRHLNLNIDDEILNFCIASGIKPEDFKIEIFEHQGNYNLYILTDNQKFIGAAKKVTSVDFDKSVPLGLMKIRILDNIPTILAVQPRFFFDHNINSELVKYLDDGISFFMKIVEKQITDILNTDSNIEKIRILTASWFLDTGIMSESTAKKYYYQLPEKSGYSIKPLDFPIEMTGGWEIDFVYEKKLEDNKEKKIQQTSPEIVNEEVLNDRKIKNNLNNLKLELKNLTRNEPGTLDDFTRRVAKLFKKHKIDQSFLRDPEIETMLLLKVINLYKKNELPPSIKALILNNEIKTFFQKAA